jgi:hypothetical protein
MPRNPQPWIVVALCGGFLQLLAAPRIADSKPRPPELQDAGNVVRGVRTLTAEECDVPVVVEGQACHGR